MRNRIKKQIIRAWAAGLLIWCKKWLEKMFWNKAFWSGELLRLTLTRTRQDWEQTDKQTNKHKQTNGGWLSNIHEVTGVNHFIDCSNYTLRALGGGSSKRVQGVYSLKTMKHQLFHIFQSFHFWDGFTQLLRYPSLWSCLQCFHLIGQ